MWKREKHSYRFQKKIVLGTGNTIETQFKNVWVKIMSVKSVIVSDYLLASLFLISGVALWISGGCLDHNLSYTPYVFMAGGVLFILRGVLGYYPDALSPFTVLCVMTVIAYFGAYQMGLEGTEGQMWGMLLALGIAGLISFAFYIQIVKMICGTLYYFLFGVASFFFIAPVSIFHESAIMGWIGLLFVWGPMVILCILIIIRMFVSFFGLYGEWAAEDYERKVEEGETFLDYMADSLERANRNRERAKIENEIADKVAERIRRGY